METNVTLNRLESLLHAIAKLYSGVFATVLQERVSSYHAEASAGYDDDIGEALRTYIKQIKQHASPHQAGVSKPASPNGTSSEHNHASSPNTVSEELNNPLADYFKKNGTHTELSSPLGEKLKRSAWDHTHTAIRLAHQGDYASAKLHADLANNAIHELGHFMPDADFIAFKAAVKAELHAKA